MAKSNQEGKKQKGMSKRSKIWMFVGIFALLVIIVAVVLVVRARANTSSAYQTTATTRGNLNATIGATGNVHANQSALLAWQTSGQVGVLNAKVGDQVKPGDVLASLTQTSLSQNVVLAQADMVTAQRNLENILHSNTQRAQAQLNLVNAQKSDDSANTTLEGMLTTNHGGTSADIENARAQLTLAQKSYDQAKAMYDSVNNLADTDPVKAQAFTTLYNAQQNLTRVQNNLNFFLLVPSGSDIDLARAKLSLAQAQLEDAQREWNRLKDGPDPSDVSAAQARVDATQATINLSRLAAPFVGTVTQADPMVGDQVSPGTMGFRVDDLSHLLVDVQVSEVDINSVTNGLNAVVTFDAVQGKEYQGKVVDVSQVGSSIQSVVYFNVTVELTNPDAEVKPGMTGSVTITVQSLENVLLVPNRAVHLVNNQRVVYVLRNGTLSEVNVTLGASDNTMSVVTAGDLSAGDLLVLNPPANFSPNPGRQSLFGGG